MTVIIIQARMGSTRLPGKVAAELAGHPLLWHVVERARAVKEVDAVVLATTTLEEDKKLLRLARDWNIPAYTGSVDDVLDRYYEAGRKMKAKTIVRVTGDCPLLDPAVSSAVVKRFRRGDFDYISNVHPPTFPDGLDTEVFSMKTLERTWLEARLPSEREHVTAYIWNHPDSFRLSNVSHTRDLSHLRWTVDEPSDLEFVRTIYGRLSATAIRPFGMEAVLGLLEREPELLKTNAGIVRDAGYLKSLQADQTEH